MACAFFAMLHTSFVYMVIYRVTYWNKILEELVVAHLVEKLPALYRTRSFITVFTRTPYWALS